LAVITSGSVSILPGNGNGTFQPAMNKAHNQRRDGEIPHWDLSQKVL
jgi:hypothetical protein